MKGLLFGGGTFILFIYILLRSFRVNLTHDEALSWTIFTGDTSKIFTANNHWLNTIISWPLGWMTQFKPWALRLPNAISFLAYSYFVYRITSSEGSSWIILIPVWTFLLTNHYVLELFGLFRGYGLALACCAGALLYAQQLIGEWTHPRFFKFQVLGLLMLYANYAFLYPLLGMVIMLLIQSRKCNLSVREILSRFKWFILLIIPAFVNILQLKGRNELYFGGESGILKDCLDSVIRYTYQFEIVPLQSEIFQWMFIGLLLLMIFIFTNTKSNRFSVYLLFFCLLLPIPLHYLAGMKFPMERSVIFLTLLMGVSAFTSLSFFYHKQNWILFSGQFILLIVLSAATLYGTCYRLNLRYASTWYYDEHNLETLNRISEHNSDRKVIRLGISWVLEPSLNYYRSTERLGWMQPLNREPLEAGGYDYYYTFEGDTGVIPDKGQVVHYYPDTRTVLIKQGEGDSN